MHSYPAEVTRIFDTQDPIPGASSACSDTFNLLMCWICSPAQSTFYQSGQLSVCLDLCTKLWSACAYMQTKYPAGATAMCHDLTYNVVSDSSAGTCFNAAPGGGGRLGGPAWRQGTLLLLTLASSLLLLLLPRLL